MITNIGGGNDGIANPAPSSSNSSPELSIRSQVLEHNQALLAVSAITNSDENAEKKQARNTLLHAVEEGILRAPLVDLLFHDSSKRAEILGIVREHKYFHRGYARRFFAAAGEILESLITEEAYVPASAFASDDDDDNDPNECTIRRSSSSNEVPPPPEAIVPDNDSTEALLFMRACSMIVGSYLDGMAERKSREISEEVLTVAELLHDVLFSLQSCGREGITTQASVCSMCQKWWFGDFQNKELLVTQLVPILLVKSLDSKAKNVDVKNMYSIHLALTLFDFEDGSISYLKSLLLKTVLCPLYHKVVEGTKFIIFLFQLHESLATDLHKCMRAQIPQAKKPLLNSYGDIYIKAWKESPEDIRTRMEENSLQDLMYLALHYEKNSSVKAVRTVLSPFHHGKKIPELDDLLYRMYSPILWRALKAANPIVRVNASAILADTFPLVVRDPGTNTNGHVVEECMDRAIHAVLSLLRDSDPRVRIAGSDAAARILLDFWTALSSESIRCILNEIITKHASDASSAAVRTSAVFAVTLLLKSPHSHAVLRSLLPSLGNLLFDKSERVRLSVVHMLLEVKQTKGIKFYHVVPVEHLLTRLAVDEGHALTFGGPVASGLTGLLLNSYFPQGQRITGAIQVQRTLNILSANPKAAHVFYRNLYLHISLNSIAKLMIMLLKCLRATVRADTTSSKNQQPTEDNTSSRTVLTASNTAVMESISETICCLWESIYEQLDTPGNEACNFSVFEAFSGAALTELYTHFERKATTFNDNCSTERIDTVKVSECYRICSALLRCAAMMPEKNVIELSTHIKSVISTGGKEESCHSDFSLQVSLLCLWGHTEDVCKSLAFLISSRFHKTSSTERLLEISHASNTNSKKSRSKSRAAKESAEILFDCSTESAIRILGKILNGSDSIFVAARTLILSSEASFNAVEKSLEEIIFSIEDVLKPTFYSTSLEKVDIFLPLLALEIYMRLAVHRSGRDEEMTKLNSNMLTIMQWITARILPSLLYTHPLGDLNVSKISTIESPMSLETSEYKRGTSSINKTQPSDRLSSPFLHSFTHDYDQVLAYSHTVAAMVVKSACIVISEWVAAGGKGVEEIVHELSKWAPALRHQTTDMSIGKELIPVYGRLIFQIVKMANNCSLLKELLMHCSHVEPGSIEEAHIQNVVLSLLTIQTTSREAVISVILEAAISTASLPSGNTNLSFHNDEYDSDSKSAISNSSAINAALSQVIQNGPGSVLLAKLISRNLSQPDLGDIAHATFQESCMKTLLERAATTGKYGAEVRKIYSEILK